MRSFKDSNGKDWVLTVNVTTRKQVLADTQFDLFGVVDGNELEKLEDPSLLVSVVYSLCAEQATKAGITPEQFAEGITGDVLDAASESLMGAIADFFPKGRRAVMSAAIAKGTEIQQKAVSLALEKIAATTLESLMPPALKSASTSSPESPASTPTV